MNKIDQPTIVKIAEVIDESSDYKTFVFDYPLNARPGQYVMLWLPKVDLKPFSIAWQTPSQFGLTALKIGAYTEKLFQTKAGDLLGILGPYGTSYNFSGSLPADLSADEAGKAGKKILIIGGGSGVASVTFLAQKAREENINVDFVLAAKAKDQLIYEDWLKKLGVNVYHRFQDNGAEHAWDIFQDLAEKNNYDGFYGCGPELLLKKVVDFSLAKNIFCQVSLERYMKCGLGVCGSCCMDPLGICLCEAGPVVNNHLANQLTEFGKYHRDGAGQKIYFAQ